MAAGKVSQCSDLPGVSFYDTFSCLTCRICSQEFDEKSAQKLFIIIATLLGVVEKST